MINNSKTNKHTHTQTLYYENCKLLVIKETNKLKKKEKLFNY